MDLDGQVLDSREAAVRRPAGAFTPYTAGMDGWVPMVQTVLAF